MFKPKEFSFAENTIVTYIN